MKKAIKWILIIFIALMVIGLIFGGNENNKGSATEDTKVVATSDTTKTDVSEKSQVVAESKEESSSLTTQQKNAVRSAKNYTSLMGFSRDGLINQLSSEYGDGYSVEDATIAIDSMAIDYNEQAAKSAKNYLDTQGFSCTGLIKQLSSDAGDKYTKEQAEYGAKKAGACD